jgi:hypothetical protein
MTVGVSGPGSVECNDDQCKMKCEQCSYWFKVNRDELLQ